MYLKDLKTLPVIQTWEPDWPYLEELRKSYLPHKGIFTRPLLCIDEPIYGCSYDYLESTVKGFEPADIRFFNEYDKPLFEHICNAGMDALKTAIKIKDWDCILYMEGDIILSSKFDKVWEQIELPDNLGLLTFYTPGYEYESPYRFPNALVYKFPGQRFYGIQCVLFTRDVVEDMVRNEDTMIKTYPGYNDIRWKEFLLARGKDFWCTARSMVQHIAPTKPHKAPSNPHTSDTFYA
jgi:hypothetical protein